MSESSPDGMSSPRKDFFCGVVEGFYGRPWTTEQRKDLFQKLKKWNADMYVYAPKDDYKHRAYWRELYTVEEAEHLTSLISAAKAQGITFCYALSPGLDITYSSQKEITTLKRKLEQVSQFGCTCFALLFDDIEPEMTEADKQIFQTFAHAQVSITNETHQHLGRPRFLLCPTQYCSTRAVPTVSSSEYLTTLGTKLDRAVDIMWTGPKVISKTLTRECISEITAVLRRAPVIWDNLHANDYDQKRIFLGPYCGRSPELIPLLRGVLTNPNCEYNANLVAIYTLALWAGCSQDAPTHMDSVSWDIKLERESEEGVCEDEAPLTLNKHVYHPRQALRLAIDEWLPEFSIPKTAQGPVIKPQPPIVPPVPIIPIVPSVNTCMTLVSCCTTLSTTQACIPTVSTSQLQALHPPTVTTAMEAVNPVSNPVMNSLVSASTVILNDAIPNPIIPMASSNINIPAELPVSTLPVPILGLKTLLFKAHDQENGDKSDDTMSDKPVQSPEGISDSLVNDSLESPSFIEQMNKKEKADMDDGDQIIVDDEKEFGHNGVMSIGETPPRLSPSRDAAEPLDADAPSDVNMADAVSENGSMQVEPSHSPLSTDMMVEAADAADTQDDAQIAESSTALTTDDLMLLCELFYLPFEHGSRALRLLHDYHWLVSHPPPPPRSKPETSEWRRRRYRFAWWAWRTRRLTRRLQLCANKELCAELYPYLWELCAVLTLLEGFVKWLELGKLPPNANLTPQGTYTWFSKGWREAFESGAQEPWVFRGGVTAELRRLVPVESSPEAARAARPPPRLPPSIVPYAPKHEQAVRELCHLTCRDGSDCTSLFPADLQDLPADRLIMPFLTLYPEYCMVVEETLEDPPAPDAPPPDEPKVIGYAVAAPDAREFYRRQEVAWIPELCNKYPKSLLERTDLSPAARECITELHLNSPVLPPAALRQHPALIQCSVGGAQPRLLVCLRAALAASGVTGAHVCINATDSLLHQFYGKLGFTELAAEGPRVYLGRTF
ncbi:protein O-GlcNAcase isoform X2 [Plutella xylostella]|uniref:protein O-GlcNAcase isoform X2 n=1 Tax=Plutella xylostella TaxID=51655 RepID=UPI002032D949|nr:protein O-GlcNAcase isoform X2 [Plutella xylostella]